MKQEPTKPGFLATGMPILKQTDESRKSLSRQGRIRYAMEKLKPVKLNWNDKPKKRG